MLCINGGSTSKDNVQSDQVYLDPSEAWDTCVVTDDMGWISLHPDCVDGFDDMFLHEDFWGFNFNNGRNLLPDFARPAFYRRDVNGRSIYLPHAVYLVQNRPKLQEVINAEQVDRVRLVENVLNSPHCANLIGSPWKVDASLYDVCKSRELVLHAFWIDVCVTNIFLYDWLNTPHSVSNKISKMYGREGRYEEKHLGYSRFYQQIENIIDRDRNRLQHNLDHRAGTGGSIESVKDGITVEQLKELNLKNLWVMNHCTSMPYAPVQEFFETLPLLGNTRKKFESNASRELGELYDRLMAIAIRTGDEWAMRSFEPPEDWDDDDDVDEVANFFNFILQIDPLLYHRYRSSYMYGPDSQEQRIEHALQAFKLAKMKYTEDVSV